MQGTDYAYTLQGWLKGVNSTSLDTLYDMGRDGSVAEAQVAKDAYDFNLKYYTGDYSPVNSSRNPFPAGLNHGHTENRPLYNGNIASMAVNIGQFNQPQLYNYQYDQLNRIVKMDVFRD